MSGEPRLGTGAAILRGSSLLLIRRCAEPEAGFWGLPGGKVDLYETATAAAEREIQEEVGITIEAIDLLCTVDQIDREAGVHWFAPVYLVTVFEGEPRIVEPHKHDGLAFFELEALPERLTRPTLGCLDALRDRLSRRSAGGAS